MIMKNEKSENEYEIEIETEYNLQFGFGLVKQVRIINECDESFEGRSSASLQDHCWLLAESQHFALSLPQLVKHP
jgi:hypothetical protein